MRTALGFVIIVRPMGIQAFQQGGKGLPTVADRADQGRHPGLKGDKGFGEAQFVGGYPPKGSGKGLKQGKTDQTGIQLNQQPFFTPWTHTLQTGLGFPQLEDQFNLPTHPIQEQDLFK